MTNLLTSKLHLCDNVRVHRQPPALFIVITFHGTSAKAKKLIRANLLGQKHIRAACATLFPRFQSVFGVLGDGILDWDLNSTLYRSGCMH